MKPPKTRWTGSVLFGAFGGASFFRFTSSIVSIKQAVANKVLIESRSEERNYPEKYNGTFCCFNTAKNELRLNPHSNQSRNLQGMF